MELRRLGDTLLRSQGSPLNFLTPSIPSSCLYARQRALKSFRRTQMQSYSVTSARCASRTPSITTSASPPQDQRPASQPTSLDPASDWTSRSRSPSSSSEFLFNKGNSASDLLNSVNALRSAQSGSSGASLPAFDINLMATPGRTAATEFPPRFKTNELMRDINRDIHQPPPARAPMRLTPSTGRTIVIGGNVDIGRGFRLLEQSCGRNKVRSDFNKQRFHERPGLKRKRLKSMRWRKRFMEGFRATVKRVKQMKAQGW